MRAATPPLEESRVGEHESEMKHQRQQGGVMGGRGWVGEMQW